MKEFIFGKTASLHSSLSEVVGCGRVSIWSSYGLLACKYTKKCSNSLIFYVGLIGNDAGHLSEFKRYMEKRKCWSFFLSFSLTNNKGPT